MATPHNIANKNQIAETVLLPGDPLRAKYIAENFLENAKQVTSVRNMLGFTGTWNGNPITVMGSGMGGPSAGIYSYELFSFYDVEKIIRIGTSGGLQEKIQPGEMVFAMTASTDSNYAYQYKLPGSFSPCGDFSLLDAAVKSARKHNFTFHTGSVFSSDLFSSYNAMGEYESWSPWARMGCLAQDMETFALYCNAAWLNKKALSIVTVTDCCVTGKCLPDEKRLSALEPMFIVALESAFN